MKRLFAIFLIFWLPMQAFAGVQVSLIDQQNQQISQLLEPHLYDASPSSVVEMKQDVGQSTNVQANQEEIGSDDDGTNDFSAHAGLGDESLLSLLTVFIDDSPELTSVQRNDDALQPPFLPPATRPPRI